MKPADDSDIDANEIIYPKIFSTASMVFWEWLKAEVASRTQQSQHDDTPDETAQTGSATDSRILSKTAKVE